MYEDQTQAIIQSRLLSRAPSTVDKREGSIIYDAVVPTSYEFFLMYLAIDYFLKNTFGDTAERTYLIERAKERGLSPTEATFALIQATYTPTNIVIPVGNTFTNNGLTYLVESASNGIATLSCTTSGIVGNNAAGVLVPTQYVSGLQVITFSELTTPGEDAEETETFRKRYLASFNDQAFGGNIADYKEKVNAIDGVGGCKVEPIWNGNGTVRVIFLTTEFKVPDASFVASVQQAIDPTTASGQGVGIAPINHVVTVIGVTALTVNISLSITFSSGNFESRLAEVKEAISKYLKSLTQGWENTQVVSTTENSNTGIIVRIALIESKILELEGIIDISNVTINGTAKNLTLDVNAIPVLGQVTNNG